MLTVVTPAASSLLTTRDKLKAELRLTGDGRDSLLDDVIADASAAIASACDRVFAQETVTETVYLDGPVKRLRLSRTPIISIASLQFDGVVLDPLSDFDLNPTAGILYRLCGFAPSEWWGRRVVVTYTGGWVLPGADGRTLPQDVERACLMTATALYEGQGRDPLLRSESVEGIGSTSYLDPSQDGYALPDRAQALLAPYCQLNF